jgi:hypothetical protein
MSCHQGWAQMQINTAEIMGAVQADYESGEDDIATLRKISHL